MMDGTGGWCWARVLDERPRARQMTEGGWREWAGSGSGSESGWAGQSRAGQRGCEGERDQFTVTCLCVCVRM